MIEFVLGVALQAGWAITDRWDGYCDASTRFGQTQVSLDNLQRPYERVDFHVLSPGFKSANIRSYQEYSNVRLSVDGKRLMSIVSGIAIPDSNLWGYEVSVSGSSLAVLEEATRNGGTISLSGPVTYDFRFGTDDRVAMNQFWECFHRPEDEMAW